MTNRVVQKALDDLLRPLGFARQKSSWNRRSARVVDVIEMQVSKDLEAFTVNIGILDEEVHSFVWETGLPAWIREPDCTVRSRLGALEAGFDKWWALSDDEPADDVCRMMRELGLLFIDRMHGRRAMRKWLEDGDVVRKRYPPPILALAALNHLEGDDYAARSILSALHERTSGSWRITVARLLTRLACERQ